MNSTLERIPETNGSNLTESQWIMSNGDVRTVTIYMIIIAVVGLVGNSLVLTVYLTKKSNIRPLNEFFILVLATIDVLACVVDIPATVAMVNLHFRIDSDVLCKMYYFFLTSSVPFSVFIITAISIDRFTSIWHPTMRVSQRRGAAIAACLGVLALVAGVLASLCTGLSSTDGVGGPRRCTDSTEIIPAGMAATYKLVHTSIYPVCLVISLIMYSLIYIRVVQRNRDKWKRAHTRYLTLRRNQRPEKSAEQQQDELLTPEAESWNKNVDNDKGSEHVVRTESEKHSPANESTAADNGRREARKLSERQMRANIQAAFMLFIVTIVFAVTYTPTALKIYRVIDYDGAYFYLYFIQHASNPVIYGFLNQDFRKRLRQLWIRSYFRCSDQTVA